MKLVTTSVVGLVAFVALLVALPLFVLSPLLLVGILSAAFLGIVYFIQHLKPPV